MTIENDAGPGAKAGQAIAAYVDSARAAFSRVRLLGNQDTLFCAPLPEKSGKRTAFWARAGWHPAGQAHSITTPARSPGTLIFIFGGADALFEQCTLRTVDNHMPSQLCHSSFGQSRWTGLCVLELRSRLGLPGRQCVSGQSVASYRQDGGAGLPPRRAHRAGGLFPLERPRGYKPGSLCRGGQQRPGAVPRPGWVHALTASQAAELLACARCRCRP